MSRRRFAAACATALVLAACTGSGDATAQSTADAAGKTQSAQDDIFEVSETGRFDQPWSMAFMPGTPLLFISEQGGAVRFVDIETGRLGSIDSGLPQVDYGGQGGLGDIVFGPDWEAGQTSGGTLYLSFAEAGRGGTRGAAVGRGTLICEQADACELQGFEVIWRQEPKVTGRGHYSHRIAFSPDGRYLFVASGERQRADPAQDLSNNLGSIVRLDLDGRSAAGNPFADRGGATAQIWSYGHRNILGLAFDPEGRLWEVEHGPAGGDELNLVERGANYGWPIVSNGSNYNGTPIPAHDTRPEFHPPAVSWTPVIAPGGMAFYAGDLFADWQGDLLIAGLKSRALVRVAFDGTAAREAARYPMDNRLREVEIGPDGAIWVLEDQEEPGGPGGRLLRLTPRS